ncbi:hypothetical protein HTZ97_09420 [Desulfuromonas acetoxidans]|uniref:Uncharacterized protein n=1 Tax=Desulfuromonas acetoxidans (strain DSM 684 / 11070) TaxID=281689 RepID=Q1K2B2_DESA6|nr:hypothetical protein [Desulfuromonas acetoxidans]EAT16527.1 hypothetical protein Dace_2622 [Desulfuromonas acetoxidans DSM 684]MBF0647061.1 hypothetical protein [Desulfuromonas acetoxidans]NVD24639.1 hypothetical protein [Desulfuromonas acetoxidans]NVE16684.1 hypothetical protein [Desulfuromonas acetoxidans]
MDNTLWFLMWLFIFVLIWLLPIVWAVRADHPQRTLIIVLVLLLGPLGFLAALILLSHKPVAPLDENDPGVYHCEHCQTPYRLSDYLDDVDIYCSQCHQQLKRPEQPLDQAIDSTVPGA